MKLGCDRKVLPFQMGLSIITQDQRATIFGTLGISHNILTEGHHSLQTEYHKIFRRSSDRRHEPLVQLPQATKDKECVASLELSLMMLL